MNKMLKVASPIIHGCASQAFFNMMLMAEDSNIPFLCNNYIPLTVKNLKGMHVDFEFDGIYDYQDTPFAKMTVVGKCENIMELIKKSIDNDVYVILTCNQIENKDYGDVIRYNNFWMINGYDEDNKTYSAYTYDEYHKISAYEIPRDDLCQKYLFQEEEWDFELYLFRAKTTYMQSIDYAKIKQQLTEYINPDDNLKKITTQFFNGENNCHEIHKGFNKEKGIAVYNYLKGEIKKNNLDNIRSFELLYEHKLIFNQIMKKILADNYKNVSLEIENLVEKAYNCLEASKHYISHKSHRNKKELLDNINLLSNSEKSSICLIKELL